MLTPVTWFTLVLLIISAVLALIKAYRPILRFHKMLDKVPGPKAYPIIGNILLMDYKNTGILPLIQGLHSTYGSIFRVYAFKQSHVVLNDAKLIEKVLSSTRHIKKSTDYNFLKPWLQEGLLTSTGLKWHTRRKILTPTFHFKILEEYISIFNKNAAIFIEKLNENLSEPNIEINNFITLCTLDIICESAMGISIDAQNGKYTEYVRAVQRISELFQIRQLRLWLYVDIIFNLSHWGREQKKVLKILHGFTSKVIKQRRAEYQANMKDTCSNEQKARKKRHLAFLDMLIEISEKEHDLTDLDIQEEVDTFMFEGHDTTTSALCWALHLLGAHPHLQDKVVEELNEIFGASGRQPSHEDLGQMKYLEQVIKETLRMFPSVPLFSRQIQVEEEIMGYIIPAGANVSFTPITLHYDPELYPNPYKFDPDRFSLEAMQTRTPYSYLPFSAGPRGCIGQRFAMMEMKVILSTVLRKYKIESLDKTEDITLLLELILRPKDPLRIKLSLRQSQHIK